MSKYNSGIKIKHESIFKQWYMQLIIWFAISGIFIALGFISLRNYAYSSIHIDANPSITLTVNKEGKVVGVFGRNVDGQIAIKVGRIKGHEVEEAMETLVTSMLENGYISQEQSAVLISVESKDEELADELQYTATDAADTALSEVLDNGVILDQVIEADASTRAMAEKYNITSGKAYLIQLIMNDAAELSASELAGCTMTELIAKCISSGVDLSQYVDIIGDALEDFYGTSGEEEGEDLGSEEDFDEDYDSEDELPDFMEGYDGQFNSEAEGFMGAEDEEDYEEETDEDEEEYDDDDDAAGSSTATVGSKRTSGSSSGLYDDDDYDEGLEDDFEDDDDYYQGEDDASDDGYDDGDDGYDDDNDDGYDDSYDDGGEAEEEIISG